MIEIDMLSEDRKIKIVGDFGIVYGIMVDVAREDLGIRPRKWPAEDCLQNLDRILYGSGVGFDAWLRFVKHRLDGPAFISTHRNDEYWVYKGYCVGKKSEGYTQELFERELLQFKLINILET